MSKCRNLTILVTLLLALVAAPQLRAAVLDELPSDSQIVIVCKPLAELSAKVNQLMMTIGVPMEQEMVLADMLGAQLSLPGLIDSKREMGIAIGNVQDAENSIVAIVPITDAAAVKQAMLDGSFTQDGDYFVSEIENVAVRPIGSYFAASSNKEYLDQQLKSSKGVKLTSTDKALLAQNDIAAVFRLNSFVPELLVEAREEMNAEIDNDPCVAEYSSVKLLANQALDRVSEVEMAIAGLRMTDAGFNISLRAYNKKGSPLADFCSGHAPLKGLDMLQGVPNKPYALAGAYSFDAAKFMPLYQALADAVLQDEKLMTKVDKGGITKLMAATESIYPLFKGMGFVQYANNPGETAQTQAGVVYWNDAEKARQINKDLATAVTKLANEIAANFVENPNIKYEYNLDAGEAGSTSYDTIAIDISQLPLPQEIMSAITAKWGGQAKLTQQVAYLNSGTMAYSMGNIELADVIDSVQSKTAGIAANSEIMATAKQLPKNSNAMVFMHLGNMIRNMMTDPNLPPQAMMMMGMFSQMPGTMGISVGLEENYMDVEYHIPMTLVQTAAQMGMQMFGGMMGGPGAAGPGMQPMNGGN